MLFKKFQQLELITLLVMSIVIPTGIFILGPSFQDEVMATNNENFQGLLPEDIDYSDLGVSWSSNLATQTEYKWIVNEFVMDGRTIYEGQPGYTSTTTYTDTMTSDSSTDNQFTNFTTGTTTPITTTETSSVTSTEVVSDPPTVTETTSVSTQTVEVSASSGIPFGRGDIISIEIINQPSPLYLNSSDEGYNNYTSSDDFTLKIDGRINEEFSSSLISLFILPLNLVYNNENYHLIENAMAGRIIAIDLFSRFTGLNQAQIEKSGDLVTVTSWLDDTGTLATVEYDYNTGIMQSIIVDGPNNKIEIGLINNNITGPALELNSFEFYTFGIALFAAISFRRKKHHTKSN